MDDDRDQREDEDDDESEDDRGRDREELRRRGALIAIVVAIVLLIVGVIFWFTAGHKPTDRELTSVMHDEHVGEPNHAPAAVCWVTGGLLLVAGVLLYLDVRRREDDEYEDDERKRPVEKDDLAGTAGSIPPGGPTSWRS